MWPLRPHPTESETRAEWMLKTKGVLPPHEQIRFYPSVALALSDLCRGLIGMYSNKKNIIRLKGLYRGYLNLTKGLSQEGALIQDLEFPKCLDLAELNGALKKDTLCVLMASDSPWTAEVFKITALWQTLLEKKIFAINVSSLPPSPNSPWEAVGSHGIWIHEFGDGSCAAILGTRFRAGTGIYGFMPPPNLDFSRLKAQETTSEKKTQILEIEKKFSSQKAPPLGADRQFDRAVLYFEDMDSSALRDLLIRKGGNAWASELEALSLCRWEDTGAFDDLLERGWSRESLRGTLIVSAALLDRNFQEALTLALTELKAMQNVIS